MYSKSIPPVPATLAKTPSLNLSVALANILGPTIENTVEAAANKYVYGNKPSIALFNQIMNDMAEKAQSDTGNKLTLLAWVA